MNRLEQHSTLSRLYALQLEVFPEHEDFLSRRIANSSDEHLVELEHLAQVIARIGEGKLETIARDYAWLTNEMLDEEYYFRRHGTYRLSTFEEAERTVYANAGFMQKYMNGVLFSHLWWGNHSRVIIHFHREFLSRIKQGAHHLEVGPGHGLLLYLAANSPRTGSVTGWDVSATSLRDTRHALEAMGVQKPVTLEAHNIVDAPSGKFDSLTFSEVLEHLEQPRDALKTLRSLLNDGGKIFVHAPVNSPAPDHIYLFREPEEIVEMVRDAGFAIDETVNFPGMDASLERARKLKLTISTIVVGTAI